MIINTLIFIVVAIMAELFIFNFRCFTTVNEKEIVVPLEYCSYEGLKEQRNDGSIVLECGENGAFVQVSIADSGIIPKNIALKASCIDGDESWWGYMREPYAHLHSTAVNTTVMLSGAEDNTIIRERLLYGREGKWDFINLPKRNDTQLITLQLKGMKGKELQISALSLNARVPLHILPMRMLMVFTALAFLYHLRAGSFVWTDSLLDEKGRMKGRYRVIASTILVSLVLFVPIMISKNTVYLQDENAFHPYTDLARALAKGQLYLDIEPSAELLALDDPYDPVAREELQVPFKLDYALYEGKYYIYFGVIPCIFMYLPWYLISGTNMPGWIALSVLISLSYIGLWLLIKNLIKRYRPDLAVGPAGLLWMGSASLLSLPAAMGDANNYYVPMLSAVVCFLFGMALSLTAADELDAGNVKKGRTAPFFGSLFMAFIAGCRPQLVLGAVCTLPFLFRLLFPKRESKIRSDWINCMVFALPYIIVAAGLMIYNALRFGSVFDFGAMKNLTFAYLDNAGFNLTAAAAGIFYYLFRLPLFTTFYPYLGCSEYVWSNPNMLASRPSIGGLIMLYPVFLLAFACFLRQTEQRGKELKIMGITSLILVPVLAGVTATMGGLMDRYRMDIAPFAALALICGVLCYTSSQIKKPAAGVMRGILIALVMISVVVSGLTYATEGLNYLQDVNPEAYMDIAKAIEFWR